MAYWKTITGVVAVASTLGAIGVFGAEAQKKLSDLETTKQIAESNADALAVIVHERALEKELEEVKAERDAMILSLMQQIAELQEAADGASR